MQHLVDELESLRAQVREFERWFRTHDRQIRFLERERQKLSALVTHTDAGFIVLDSSLQVVWTNGIVCTWFDCGTITESARCHDLLCGGRSVCEDCPARRALERDVVAHREVRLEFGGRLRHVYATAMPIKSPEGEVDETILMLQDLTDLELLRQSKRALEDAKAAADAANRAKSEFLANMSHEIRTPMTGVIGMTGLLMDTEMEPTQRHYVKIVQSSAHALLAVINDILDFSKIESGKLTIEPVPFDLSVTVGEVVDLLSEQAAEKGIELAATCAKDIPRSVIGDAGRIRQVLINLVGNAIKFTHEGRVSIDARKLWEGQGVARVRISVEDTGVGIPEEKLRVIFEKFTQADGSITRKFGGTGLGLAISKELVEMMGGEITVTSSVRSGANFCVTLDLPVGDADRPPARRRGTRAGAGARDDAAGRAPCSRRRADREGGRDVRQSVRVLVVEDNVANQRAVVHMLEALGCRVDVAANGIEAVRMVETMPYDLVIMDCQMPEMDGYEATRAIREHEDPALRRLPVVALTANALSSDRDRCMEAGMDDYVAKPVDKETLADIIARHVSSGAS